MDGERAASVLQLDTQGERKWVGMPATVQRVLDVSQLGSTFVGVILVLLVALLSARANGWRATCWLAVVSEVCLLAGVILFNALVWRLIGSRPASDSIVIAPIEWWRAISGVLLQAGLVTGVVAFVLTARELARRGERRWPLLSVAGLALLMLAYTAYSTPLFVDLFSESLLMKLLVDSTAQRVYYSVVSLLLVGAPLVLLVYISRRGRASSVSATSSA